MSQLKNDQQFTRLAQGKVSCLFDKTLISNFIADMLSPQYWQQKNSVTGSAQGRGTTWFLTYKGENNSQHDWVLRHYYRGGLMGKINKDYYWFTGINNTRAAREFSLLQQMQTLQLPAPAPIAYRVIRHGLYYQADLLSSRIQHAQDLVARLSNTPLNDDIWYNIGVTIKRFHQHGVYHHDLNSHNILLDDDEQVFLIDFDRGELRAHSKNSAWKKANMARLQRSFLKELNLLEQFYFTDNNWQTLMSGYQGHK